MTPVEIRASPIRPSAASAAPSPNRQRLMKVTTFSTTICR
jgi:hypothetical protein